MSIVHDDTIDDNYANHTAEGDENINIIGSEEDLSGNIFESIDGKQKFDDIKYISGIQFTSIITEFPDNDFIVLPG